MATAATAETSLGVIQNGASYPLQVFMRLAGLNTWAMRQARRKGLKVVKVGRRQYVRGADWSSFLERQGSAA